MILNLAGCMRIVEQSIELSIEIGMSGHKIKIHTFMAIFVLSRRYILRTTTKEYKNKIQAQEMTFLKDVQRRSKLKMWLILRMKPYEKNSMFFILV